MKKYVLGIALLGLGFGLKAQDLYIKFSGGTDVRDGLKTVDRITFSATDMQVEMGAGNRASYGLDSIAYFNYKASIVSGVAAKELQGKALELYPNPATSTFFINYTAEATAYTLRLLNLSGQEVYSQSGQSLKGENRLSVEVQNLPNGLYFVELKSGANKQIEKIVINK